MISESQVDFSTSHFSKNKTKLFIINQYSLKINPKEIAEPCFRTLIKLFQKKSSNNLIKK